MPAKNSNSSASRDQQRLQALNILRSDFGQFARIMRRGRIELAPPHRKLIEVLEGIESGRYDRAIVMMPPRNGKSLLSSELFPPWYLSKHPDRSIIAASY